MVTLGGWFRLASELGMTLNECMTKVSWPEYLLWCQWFDSQWSVPDLTDYYLMRLTHQVAMQGRTRSKAFNSEHYRLKFKSTTQKQLPQITVEQATALSKARWSRLSGVKFRKINNGNRN